MYIYRPKNPNGLLLVCDTSMKYDRDHRAENGGDAVMDKWRFGRAVYGEREWARTTRVSLYQYGEDAAALGMDQARAVREEPEKKRGALTKRLIAGNRAAKRQALRDFLHAEQFPVTMILESPNAADQDKETASKNKTKGTVCWSALGPPDSLPEMSGTVWTSLLGRVVPLLFPRNNGNFVWSAEVRKWMLGSQGLVRGTTSALTPKETVTEPTPEAYSALKKILVQHEAGVPVALDLETFQDRDLITCVGLSIADVSVSVPWEAFQPYGQDYTEAAALPSHAALVQQILNVGAPKITHNGIDFDVPYLRRKGVSVNGKVLDTYLMHGVAHKQLRHGLQRALTTYYMVPPWKSLHLASGANKSGLTKEDGEFWIQDPKELRGYNAKDAFYTWHLGAALRPKVGV